MYANVPKKMLFILSCDDLSKKRTGPPPFVRPMPKRKRDEDRVSQIVDELEHVDPHALPAAKQLYEMIQSGDANVQQLQRDSTLINRLVAMLSRDDDKCRIAAANVLGLLATIEDTHKLMVDAGACEPLVQMLCSEDDKCKYAAITVIVCMSATKGIDQLLVDAGVIKPCLNMIQSDHRDIAVRVVSHLAAIKGLHYRFAEAGAIKLLGDLVCDKHHNVATLALFHLSTPLAWKLQIADTGVIQHLVAMIREKEDENAVGLLSNLSFSAELRVKIANCEAIESLVVMLSSNNNKCRWKSSIALMNLAISNEQSQRIVSAGAIPPAVAALASDDHLCQVNAAMLIRSLMEYDESGDIRLQAVNAGVCPALVGLLRTGDNETMAQSASASALCLLSQCDKVVKHMMFVDGLFYVLAGCLAKDTLRIGELCFGTLYNIHTKTQTQMSKCTHLIHGTLLVLRSLPGNTYVRDYLSLILLTDDMLSQAMRLLHSFVSNATACLICIGILMSCDENRIDTITLRSLTQVHFRSVLQPVLERALGNGELAVSHGRGSMCMQAAIAMERVLRVSDISVKLNTFVVHPPTSTTKWQDYSDMLGNRALADVTFIVEDEEVFAHKFILCTRCEYFKRMFSAPMLEQRTNEVRVKDCSLSTFRIIRYFLYSGKTDGMLTPNTAQDVLVVANRYQVLPLVRTVESYLRQQLDVSNALLMWTFAGRMAKSFELKTASMNYMLCHLSSVVAEFENVPGKERRKDGLSGFDDPAFRKTVVEAFFKTVIDYLKQ